MAACERMVSIRTLHIRIREIQVIHTVVLGTINEVLVPISKNGNDVTRFSAHTDIVRPLLDSLQTIGAIDTVGTGETVHAIRQTISPAPCGGTHLPILHLKLRQSALPANHHHRVLTDSLYLHVNRFFQRSISNLDIINTDTGLFDCLVCIGINPYENDSKHLLGVGTADLNTICRRDIRPLLSSAKETSRSSGVSQL